MCAIIGAVGERIPARDCFERARDTMAHRGPDDAGTYYAPEEGVALGHRRLAIIDLSDAGRQPMESADGRYVLVYNGEIYNYLELKEELEGLYPFKTKTDSEVLLASFIKWGVECVSHFNGMFAFAIWDKKEKKLFCARDRFGEKPFFYSLRGDTFYFSSEIKGLLALGIPARANEGVIFDYLSLGYYDHTDETFFEGVRVLPAAHTMMFSARKVLVTRYWNIAKESVRIPETGQEAEERYQELLADSIRLRFRSDVPVGINLSSGVDSNSLRYFSERVTGKTVDMFSVCLPSEEYNECALIVRFLTDEEKKHWYTVTVAPVDAWNSVEQMNSIQDEPYGGIPTLAYMGLMKLVRDTSVTVLLEGQGLDELLAGYAYFRPVMEGRSAPAGASQDLTREIDQSVLNPEFLARFSGRGDQFSIPTLPPLREAQYRDLAFTKLPRVLRFNDHVSMAFSRELRMPFLDHHFAAFCFHLPDEYKISRTEQKFLNRRVMSTFLPDIVQRTPKKAFGAIQTEWLRENFKEPIQELLSSRSFRGRTFWDHDRLLGKVERFSRGEGDNSFFIWQCVNLELWFRSFIDSPRP